LLVEKPDHAQMAKKFEAVHRKYLEQPTYHTGLCVNIGLAAE
jgi:hypothetical protein